MTQAELAREAGLTRETVARLEATSARPPGGYSGATGRSRRRPVADTVFRLESALDFYAEQFVPAWREWKPIGSSEPGARSRERRRELGLSLAEVARGAGVSVATLSRFEREERPTPSLLRVVKSELGGEWPYLVSERLASALGFASLEEHSDFCDGS